MSSFNNALKNIPLKNLAIFIVVTYLILSVLSNFNNMLTTKCFYVIVIVYFAFVLRGHFQSLKEDAGNMFSKIDLKYILAIVSLNIIFSYGMLYLSDAIIIYFPFSGNVSIPTRSLVNYLPSIWGFVATIIVSPISEELIFRGVFLNRLKLCVPTVFAIFISSLLFGSLHNFGSMISAVVFAVSMAIIYIKTENICVPIFAHFLNNLFAETIKFFDVNNVLFTNYSVMGIVSVLAVISAILLALLITKELNNIK